MKYLEFNGIRFSADSPFPFYSFSPNEGTTEYQSDTFVGQDGENITNIRYPSRMVSLSGNIVADTDEQFIAYRQQLFTKCNGKTKEELYYFDGFTKYKAAAIANIPQLGETHATSQVYNVNFILLDFYWQRADKTIIPLFERIDTVETSFTLPCVFTKRTAGATIYNGTDFDIYPILKIGIINSETVDLKIKNETSGAVIELPNYSFNAGETLIIDTEKYKAAINGINIINSLNDFSDWRISPGENVITIKNGENSVSLNAVIEYNDKLVGV